ncbi:MAG: alkyl sulfatase dimerization domain-containing protein [Microthrixaceae bacterium]
MARSGADVWAASEDLIEGRTVIDSHHPVSIATGATLCEVDDRVAFVESFANAVAVRDSGHLGLVDAGSPLHADAIVGEVRSWTADPLRVAVYTHGHVDHIYGVARFEAEGNGDAHVIAHEAVTRRFDRYELTAGYNGLINQRQFQLPAPYFPGDYRYPDETYVDSTTAVVGTLPLELRHDRGETDDATWVWLPESRAVATGDLFIWASPNCGNPQKVQRYCDEWAAALRSMADLEPEFLLPGHGLPIAGADRVRRALTDTARYLQSLFDQTIDLMNEGARLDDIIHTVTAPADLVDRPYLQPVYDEPEFVVRNIWRLYGGWYDGNPARLKPAPDSAVAAEVAALAGGVMVLAERALGLAESGDHRLAGHLIEYATLAAPEDPEVRAIRARVFGERASVERSTMARGVFTWAADHAT